MFGYGLRSFADRVMPYGAKDGAGVVHVFAYPFAAIAEDVARGGLATKFAGDRIAGFGAYGLRVHGRGLLGVGLFAGGLYSRGNVCIV